MATKVKSKGKYFCTDKEKLVDFLKAEGFIFRNSVLENDIFYTDTDLRILENDSCIRIRTTNNKEIILNFEGAIDNISAIDISDSQSVHLDLSQRDNISKFIETLGYYKYVSMNILKETYVKKDKEYYYSVSVDTIENICEFVDFEIYSEKDDEKALNYVFYSFEDRIEKIVDERSNIKYRDYASAYLYANFLKGDYLNRILVEQDKIFVNLDPYNMEESIKENVTLLNLELIEKLEQIGINVEIVYSNSDEIMINTLKKILDKIGYNPIFTNVKDIKELSVKETLILEKQKKTDFSEVAFIVMANKR